MLDDVSNNGRVTRFPRSNERGVLDRDRRRNPERRFDDGRDISATGVWIAVIALAVVVAGFGDSLFGQW